MVRFISFVSSVNLYLIEREEEQQQQETMVKEFKSFFTARKGPTITRERKRELDVAFFKMIYMDYEPLSIGEREGMQHFASAAQPDNINRLLVKVGKLVKSVRKSTLNTEETDQLGVRPTNACATRWSSQLRMIQLWQNKLKSNVANITLNQVRQLTHLVSVLTPLADLTEKMQKELGNLGMILPAVTEIKSLLTDDTHAALPMGIAAFAETLANNVWNMEWNILY